MLKWKTIYNSTSTDFHNFIGVPFTKEIKKYNQPTEERLFIIDSDKQESVKITSDSFAYKTFTWTKFIRVDFHKHINNLNQKKQIFFVRDGKQYHLSMYIDKSESDLIFDKKMKLVKQAYDYFHKLEDFAKSKGCKYMSSDKMLCDSDKEYFYLDAEKIKAKIPEDVYNMMVNMKLLHLTCKARGSTR